MLNYYNNFKTCSTKTILTIQGCKYTRLDKRIDKAGKGFQIILRVSVCLQMKHLYENVTYIVTVYTNLFEA